MPVRKGPISLKLFCDNHFAQQHEHCDFPTVESRIGGISSRLAITDFTLIEVVVALAILTMGLLASLSLTATSQQRLSKSVRHWEAQHMMAQALEYYLLTNGTTPPPPEVFPYPEYQVRCDFEDAAGLPDGIDARNGNWRLRTMTVSIIDRDGKVVAGSAVDRIIKDTD